MTSSDASKTNTRYILTHIMYMYMHTVHSYMYIFSKYCMYSYIHMYTYARMCVHMYNYKQYTHDMLWPSIQDGYISTCIVLVVVTLYVCYYKYNELYRTHANYFIPVPIISQVLLF